MANSTTLPAVIQPGLTLTTGLTTIATCPANTQLILRSSVFSNNTGSAVTITVNRNSFGIIAVLPIAADTAYVSSELAGMILNPGDTLAANCSSGGSVNVFIRGFSFVG
jgi:hypothetical protein